MKSLIVVVVSMFLTLSSCNNSGNGVKVSDSTAVITDHNNMSATGDSSSMSAINDMDREFVMKVSMANTAEMEAARVASQKSNDAGIKDFAAMMIKDHGDAQSKLKGIAASLSLSAPDSTDMTHQDMKNKLSSLSGKKFNEEYVDAQVKDHRDAVDLFEKEINGGSNASVKGFASDVLPHIKMHLQMADSLKMKK